MNVHTFTIVTIVQNRDIWGGVKNFSWEPQLVGEGHKLPMYNKNKLEPTGFLN